MRKTVLWIAAWLVIVPALMSLSLAQSGVRAVVVNEVVNVRVAPAIGADVIASVPAGTVFEVITARSADNQWLRIDFNGGEGWINVAPLSILSGDVAALPVADPRSIPYGGFEAPRAGPSNATSDKQVRITNGLRLRAGPSQAYPTLANLFANTVVPVLGRTANNGWIQVNYEGTLGWVSVSFVQFLNGVSLVELPIEGIVADSPPIVGRTTNDLVDTLKLMLERIDLAQPSLDNIRAKWTDSALTKRAACRDYPARPSDINIAVPLLAQYNPTLDPLQRDFNDAMANLRLAIDLFIEACNQPGFGNPVGEATIIGALNAVNLADSQFASLRARLRELIPPDREPGPNECLFTFNGRSEILPVIALGQVVRVPLTLEKRSAGFCFDAFAQQNLALLVLVIKGPARPLAAMSPFDNPTNFLAIGSVTSQPNLTLAPILTPVGGRFLALLYDGTLTADSEIALAVVNYSTVGVLPVLTYDATTDTVSLTSSVPGVATATPFGSSSGQSDALDRSLVTCPSVAFTCTQLFTCQEAYACLAAGNVGLDPDGNGVPCENLCVGSP